MSDQISLKEISQQLRKKEGNARGDIILGNFSYIRQKEGEVGIAAVKRKIKELGYPINVDKIKPLEWYPESFSVMVILAAKEVFQWKDEDVFEMGKQTTKHSLVMKMLIKYFSSLEMVFTEASKYWEKYLDVGKLKIIKINNKEKFILLTIEGYNFHPDICLYHAGKMLQIAQLCLNKKDIRIEETKCAFKGDLHHEYLINWK